MDGQSIALNCLWVTLRLSIVQSMGNFSDGLLMAETLTPHGTSYRTLAHKCDLKGCDCDQSSKSDKGHEWHSAWVAKIQCSYI